MQSGCEPSAWQTCSTCGLDAAARHATCMPALQQANQIRLFFFQTERQHQLPQWLQLMSRFQWQSQQPLLSSGQRRVFRPCSTRKQQQLKASQSWMGLPPASGVQDQCLMCSCCWQHPEPSTSETHSCRPATLLLQVGTRFSHNRGGASHMDAWVCVSAQYPLRCLPRPNPPS